MALECRKSENGTTGVNGGTRISQSQQSMEKHRTEGQRSLMEYRQNSEIVVSVVSRPRTGQGI